MLKVQSFTFNPFQENTYLISNAENLCWIVDPGMYDAIETKKLTDHIAAHHLHPQAIINTHTHIDHIFGVQVLKDKYGIPFGAHELEKPVLNGAVGSAVLFGFDFKEAPAVDFYISEKEPYVLGDQTLQVILAPGHSPGSICFYHPLQGWLIGGDVLFAGSIGRSDLPGGNGEVLLNSIRTQLLTLPDTTIVYPGHGPATSIGREKATNPYLAS